MTRQRLFSCMPFWQAKAMPCRWVPYWDVGGHWDGPSGAARTVKWYTRPTEPSAYSGQQRTDTRWRQAFKAICSPMRCLCSLKVIAGSAAGSARSTPNPNQGTHPHTVAILHVPQTSMSMNMYSCIYVLCDVMCVCCSPISNMLQLYFLCTEPGIQWKSMCGGISLRVRMSQCIFEGKMDAAM